MQGYDGSRLTRGRHTYGDPLVVTNDAWLGRGSRVLSGVTIGDGAVVGAYTVVTKDVRPYAIVVRHPAREIRRRLTDEQVDALERIGWWDWPDERIVAEVDQLSSHRLDAFIAAHDPGR
ncbi:MAG: CatB-related O-acetyltransferase [Solirubrobacteraceae bacterium]